MDKQCSKCKKMLTIECFPRNKKYKTGYEGVCLECKRSQCKLRHKRYYLKHSDKVSTKNRTYKRSLEGKAVRMWNDITKRVTKHPAYAPRGVRSELTREEFISWILNDSQYKECYNKWVKEDYKLSSSPSVDRIDTEGHYTLDNIRVVSLQVNQRRPKAKKIKK